MTNLFADVAHMSLNKNGEQLCGDMVNLIRQDGDVILVLADGLGSGVKANILATLTGKIISTMIAEKMSIDDCVSTIAATLPVCQKRGVAYSTFTIIKVNDYREAEIIQYDNPNVILLRKGKSFDYAITQREIEGKKILESKIKLELDDVFVAMSDGAIYAGVGEVLNYGWQRENIVAFLEDKYNYKLTAKTITSMILNECNRLYMNRPGDDTTIATVQIRRRKTCNIMIGPPAKKEDDERIMRDFFSHEGKHIICGGTTAQIAARYLNKDIETNIDYFDPSIPPTASIEGVDLVTEGVLTINRVVDYANNYLADNSLFREWSGGAGQSGAAQISRMLFEEATDINIYLGRAINSAHQNPDLPITFSIKSRLTEELVDSLRKMGKFVTTQYN